MNIKLSDGTVYENVKFLKFTDSGTTFREREFFFEYESKIFSLFRSQFKQI